MHLVNAGALEHLVKRIMDSGNHSGLLFLELIQQDADGLQYIVQGETQACDIRGYTNSGSVCFGLLAAN